MAVTDEQFAALVNAMAVISGEMKEMKAAQQAPQTPQQQQPAESQPANQQPQQPAEKPAEQKPVEQKPAEQAPANQQAPAGSQDSNPASPEAIKKIVEEAMGKAQAQANRGTSVMPQSGQGINQAPAQEPYDAILTMTREQIRTLARDSSALDKLFEQAGGAGHAFRYESGTPGKPFPAQSSY